MLNSRLLDIAIVAAYMATMAGVGLYFSRRQSSTEAYFVARRSVPAWAMGLSLLAALVSSVTFVAYPGSAYARDWSLLVPGLMVLIILGLVSAVVIPFYREVVGMTAYEYFGRRFGRGIRAYGSFAYILAQFSKMGFVVGEDPLQPGFGNAPFFDNQGPFEEGSQPLLEVPAGRPVTFQCKRGEGAQGKSNRLTTRPGWDVRQGKFLQGASRVLFRNVRCRGCGLSTSIRRCP